MYDPKIDIDKYANICIYYQQYLKSRIFLILNIKSKNI